MREPLASEKLDADETIQIKLNEVANLTETKATVSTTNSAPIQYDPTQLSPSTVTSQGEQFAPTITATLTPKFGSATTSLSSVPLSSRGWKLRLVWLLR
jgi:hypothetical protein